MSAETLKRAAALMRQRAVNATASHWVVDEPRDGAVDIRARRGAGPTVATTVPLGYVQRRSNAEYIASWHPTVALAIADWLDLQAERLDGVSEGMIIEDHPALRAVLEYLGED